MGLDLAAVKDKKTAKKVKRSGDKAKASKFTKKRASASEVLEPDDEVVTVATEITEAVEEAAASAIRYETVAAFEQGLVHPAFANAVNSYWKKSSETSIFMAAMTEELAISGTFFGAIFVKPSFVRKTGGSVLL